MGKIDLIQAEIDCLKKISDSLEKLRNSNQKLSAAIDEIDFSATDLFVEKLVSEAVARSKIREEKERENKRDIAILLALISIVFCVPFLWYFVLK